MWCTRRAYKHAMSQEFPGDSLSLPGRTIWILSEPLPFWYSPIILRDPAEDITGRAGDKETIRWEIAARAAR
jgi:hypothetical protein